MWETRAQLRSVFREMQAGWLASPLRLYVPLDAYVLKVSLALCILLEVYLGTHDLVCSG